MSKELTTARCRLRPMTCADWPQYSDFMASERSRYMGGPYDEASAWGVFCHDIATWSLFGMGALMIDLLEGGDTVGQVGINNGPMFPETELGWLLFEGFEGQGYAQEAAQALRHWAMTQGGVSSLVSYVDPANHASARVAERLGAVRDPDAPRQDPDDIVFRHPCP